MQWITETPEPVNSPWPTCGTLHFPWASEDMTTAKFIGQARPSSAEKMEQMLTELVPPDRRTRIAVRVIDVSGIVPSSAEPKRKPKISNGRRKKAKK
jgi:hypothetical protein